MKLLVQCVAVGGAGACGAVMRLLVAVGCAKVFGSAFPWGTLLINISGSLLLGWVLTLTHWDANLRLAIATGFLGAYTTFSTFMYESNALMEGEQGMRAAIYLAGSVLLGLMAVRAGLWLGR